MKTEETNETSCGTDVRGNGRVTLIGLKIRNNGIIRAVELTPDLLSKKLILITGTIGEGKSTLLNSAKIATAGTAAIKKSDAVPSGFLTEALLLDGKIPIFIGVKANVRASGVNEGKTKLETYLYTKDANGKAVQPIIDGVAWTATQYWKALTTELTHSLNDLFSENQATHRKLIEHLFSDELKKLKIDELVAEIDAAKKSRDIARMICQANGAYMERFKEEGYEEHLLDMLERIDTNVTGDKIVAAQIQKDRMVQNVDLNYELTKSKLNAERAEQLHKIKDDLDAIQEKLRIQEEQIESAYSEELSDYNRFMEEKMAVKETYTKLRDELARFIGYEVSGEYRNEQGVVFKYDNSDNLQIICGLDKKYQERMMKYSLCERPKKKECDKELREALEQKRAEYSNLKNSEIVYPQKDDVDTSDIDRKINELRNEKESQEKNNRIYDRYQMWRSWIEAKGEYERLVDVLRKRYASIETGVDGLKIAPRETESGRIEIWIVYNGQYNPSYFGNNAREDRFLFEYSSFQRVIIGLMLQAARLDLKPKALRLAYIDDVAFCKKDVEVLANIADKLDLKLITAWTHEADKSQLMDGQVLIEGGEVFFN